MLPIAPTEEETRKLRDIFLNHDFEQFRELTRLHRACEMLNLQKEEKLELLKRLSIEKESTSFTDFWVWFRKNCAMNFAKQFSKHLYPTDDAYAQRNYNQMRASKSHPFWNHIKARIYKMWCSIITEKQCIQSLYQYIQESKKDWKIYTSVELDSAGIDLVLHANNKWIPIQIKKDSYIKVAQSKQNALENLSRFEIKKQKQNVLFKSLEDQGFSLDNLEEGLLLKYNVPTDTLWVEKSPLNYIGQLPNGFIYFKSQELGELISSFVPQEKLTNKKKKVEKIKEIV